MNSISFEKTKSFSLNSYNKEVSFDSIEKIKRVAEFYDNKVQIINLYNFL